MLNFTVKHCYKSYFKVKTNEIKENQNQNQNLNQNHGM